MTMRDQFSWSPETAAQRLEAVEKRLASNDPALTSVFTQTFFKEAGRQIERLDEHASSPLCGALVSVKDLFDVDGFVTRAGTTFMAQDTPAKSDAPPIKQLRDAGGILVGHTNMTELAYSGLGLNPHYGTPDNALRSGCIPGGSTAGGAVSVARGAADIAVGTDTGGSLRIPAAFNGIVGFKPTQSTVSRKGCKALSQSLDSVGPMARSVAACALSYSIMSDAGQTASSTLEPDFVIPTNYGMDDLAPEVATAFEDAVSRLSKAGHKITRGPVETLEALKSLAIWQFASIESRAEYDEAFRARHDDIDPRISSRMARADEASAVSYRKTLNLRQDLIEQYLSEMGGKILLMPTVPILPPSVASLADDAEYGRVNLQVLRNPSIANVMDCCSISLPFTESGHTIGVMLTATAGHDRSLLDLAEKCAAEFAR